MNTNTPSLITLSARAFKYNCALYKRLVGEKINLALVVKSNAYGHGLKEIGELAQKNSDIAWFCTTSLTEALQLREYGVTKPILVMAVIDADVARAIEHDIDLIAYDMPAIKAYAECGQRLGKKVAIHIKIDTGLSRFGFLPDEAISVAQQVAVMPGINLRGIYTHLAEADNEDQTFTKKQLALFGTVLAALDAHGITIPVRHAGNSSASVLCAMPGCTMVRIGGGAYGLRPFATSHELIAQKYPDFQLKQMLTWKTQIMHVRTIAEGSFIGYARTYAVKKPTTIALVPVGYYEGYDRRFSNCGTMVVVTASGAQVRVPVVGRVCMNVTMIDVSAVPGVATGDEVFITADMDGIRSRDLVDAIGSYNPREFVVRLNPLLPRMIVD